MRCSRPPLNTIWGYFAVFFMAVGIAQATVLPPVVSPSSLPNLTLPDMAGRLVGLKSLEGKLLIVSLWANWCPFCHQEALGLVRLHKQFDSKVRFVGIAIDNKESAERFILEEKVNYLTLLAEPHPGHVLTALGDRRGMLPYTILVLPSGRIVSRHIGYYAEKTLRHSIDRVLEKSH